MPVAVTQSVYPESAKHESKTTNKIITTSLFVFPAVRRVTVEHN